MFDDLKRVFSRSWASFLDEVGRREPEDQVAELLSAMRREMVQARADLPLHDQAVQGAEAELERERRALADAERRGGLAERIGDAETVRVAAEFADRHRRRAAVLEEKARAARAERDLAQQEAAEMMRRYKEADANRFALVAEIRRRGTQARLDAMGGGAAGLGGSQGTDPSAPRAADVDDRLAELKRRMGM